jgi:prepilin-type N-terminal cleavage/methylation domain-containing protein
MKAMEMRPILTPMNRTRRQDRGFTALELMIALVLVAILAAVSWPSFARITTPFRVQSAGREVYSALQEARQQAIARSRRTRFQVVGAQSYTLQWDDAGTWRTIRGPIDLEKGVQLTSSGGDLIFHPRGTVFPLSTMTISDQTDPVHRLVVTATVTGLIRLTKGGD